MIGRRGDGYRVRVYFRGRYVVSRTFRRLGDARAWERAQLDALQAGTWVHPDAGMVTVGVWVERWFEARSVSRPSTTARVRGLIDHYVVPEFGRRPLVSIAPSDVARWVSRVSEQRSASTARQALGVVRQAFAMAVADGVVTRNPAEGVRAPRQVRGEPSPLTHDQLWRLADAMGSQRDRLMVLVAGYGGLRWGELVGLQVRDVRVSDVRLVRSVSEVSGVLHVGPLKSHQTRTVPLPQTVMEGLRLWVDGRKGDVPVFADERGGMLRYGNWRKRCLEPACTAVGLSVTPHHLRDTCATLAIASGASVVSVARLLGHENPSTTLSHYAGYFPTDLETVAERLDVEARKHRR